ncbi:trypsin-like peptidase domain-containing protein [Candidatus Bathyarchaeota archaeon]|nr:trypsin-like peptidase domain-containing protein [Candidatus Bathyarchaeota archaeon]
MFQETCVEVRNAIYGVLCHSDLGNTRTAGCSSGFTIAPGIIATVAHGLHINGDFNEPIHEAFEVIRTPDIGEDMKFADVIAVDDNRDLAFLRIQGFEDMQHVQLINSIVPIGTSCGFLGFPLSTVGFPDNGLHFTLNERFQGAYVSAYLSDTLHDMEMNWYETDQLMYSGSSGCPGFILDGRVFGMQSNTLTTEASSDDESKRLAIARQVPSTEIIAYARANGINI